MGELNVRSQAAFPHFRTVMKRLFLTSLLIVMSVMSLTACSAQKPAGHLQTIKQAGVIKVGTSADYPPFEYIDNSGKKLGFDIALMEEIARHLGVKLEWVDMPFDSLTSAVQDGKLDAAISAINYSEACAGMVSYSEPYYLSGDVLVVAESFTGQISKPVDAASYKVGVQTGATQDYWLVENLVDTGMLPQTRLFRYERADQAAKDLKKGIIEVWMTDTIVGQALVQQLGGIKVVYQGTLSSSPLYVILQKDDQSLQVEINKIIWELDDQGFIQQLALQYIAGIQ
jgi:ABC-type amino acid transport substrate-binding protein